MLDLATTSPGGIRIYDAVPGVAVEPILINAYSTLTIPAYWRAINFLADNLASFPRAVHRDGSPAPEHPLNRLLSRRGRPNALQNAFIFWRTLFLHAAHRGNGYARIDRAAFFGATALHNLLPEDVYPFRYDRDDGRGPQQFYIHRPTKRVMLGADVIHIQALGHDGMSGTDPVTMHAATFQRAATLDRYQTRYLQRGTMVKGAIEIPAGVAPEQVAQVKAILREFSGANAERDVLVLSDGAKLNNTTLSPQESQLVQQGAHTTKQVAQITGVPPQFLYEFSEAKYNSSAVEATGQDVVRYTFRPWIEQTEAELSLKLLTEAEQREKLAIGLNPDALLRGDTKTQVDTVVATVTGGLRTRNEGRALLNLPPDEDPESDKLKTLGDTTPAPTAGSAGDDDAAATEGDGDAGGTTNTEVKADSSLNGAQITAVLDVLARLTSGGLTSNVAVELLVAVGILRDRAEQIVREQGKLPPPKPVPPSAPADTYAALAPVIAAACARVDQKTEKAFASHGRKTGQELTIWGNVFAEEQRQYAVEALTPVADALATLGAPRPDVAKLGERYAAAIRQRTANGTVVTLAKLLEGKCEGE